MTRRQSSFVLSDMTCRQTSFILSDLIQSCTRQKRKIQHGHVQYQVHELVWHVYKYNAGCSIRKHWTRRNIRRMHSTAMNTCINQFVGLRSVELRAYAHSIVESQWISPNPHPFYAHSVVGLGLILRTHRLQLPLLFSRVPSFALVLLTLISPESTVQSSTADDPSPLIWIV